MCLPRPQDTRAQSPHRTTWRPVVPNRRVDQDDGSPGLAGFQSLPAMMLQHPPNTTV
jgi:hypothetical protein